jgi:hypothetical protein
MQSLDAKFFEALKKVKSIRDVGLPGVVILGPVFYEGQKIDYDVNFIGPTTQ